MERVYVGKIDKNFVGKEVSLFGWVHSRRDHGGVIFIDLRDREGVVQLVFQPENKKVFSEAERLRNEFVVKVKGKVRLRPEGTQNPKIYSGEVEVVVEDIEVLNTSEVLPFEISEYKEVSEDLRLKYRYLDIRRQEVYKVLKLRSDVLSITRNFFIKNGFLEVETPMLTKSTPEGARDFLVPSRINQGTFYALPQSPQLFKQVLMVGGIDKYFQIVKCFRDEDLRSDRQPEFTQIDFEMSFVKEEEVISTTEKLLDEIFYRVKGKRLSLPLPRMSYDEAISRYGTDRPDIRYGLEIKNITSIFSDTNFKVFKDTISKGGDVNVIVVPCGAQFSRQQIDDYISFIKSCGGLGLAWVKFKDDNFESNIVKFFSQQELNNLKEKLELRGGEIIFFSAGERKKSCELLGFLRQKLARDMQLVNNTDEYQFLWVVDFPLFEYSEEEKKIVSVHHPFTMPREEDIHLLEKEPLSMKSCAYDIVVNGVEIGGGSIRIHNGDLQKKVFSVLGLSNEEINSRFGFLVEALNFGAPPHGGLAIGFDRLLAILENKESIREVIPFPKTQKGVCMLTEAPSVVEEKQLRELGIMLRENKK